jgi:hypothetical protein
MASNPFLEIVIESIPSGSSFPPIARKNRLELGVKRLIDGAVEIEADQ